MLENDKPNLFVPLIDFNDPILAEIEQKIRPFLDAKSPSLSREFQIRSFVYINFNKYLTKLLSQTDKEAVALILKEIDEKPETPHLQKLSLAIKKPITIIINNFIELLAQSR